MLNLIIDVETSVTKIDGKHDPSPYRPGNRLVSVGWVFVDRQDLVAENGDYIHGCTIGRDQYVFLDHNDFKNPELARRNREKVQAALDNADRLVGHNLKFDLQWLLEAGFKFEGDLYCTQIGEYVLARGQKWPLSLEASCRRRGVAEKKKSLIADYWNQGIGFEAMPMEVVEEYGRGDIVATAELYVKQLNEYEHLSNRVLIPTRDMSNEFLAVLTDAERNGIAIDAAALDAVANEYERERDTLSRRLRDIVQELAGDTPVNLGSPEQLSEFVYSRRVVDKPTWGNLFNLGKDHRGKDLPRPRLKDREFQKLVHENTTISRRTSVVQCADCRGSGYVQRYCTDGRPRKNLNICPRCNKAGVVYNQLPIVSGLKCVPRDVFDVASGGFSTDKETLSYLARVKEEEGDKLAVEFLSGMVRLNAVETYLSSFVGGIKRGVINDILHTKFNQTVTSTGRLSSTDPNFQNQPRGSTFPIRRVVISRWKNGTILEGDFSTLEFSVAGELSGDEQVFRDIASKFDVHSYTASIIFPQFGDADANGRKEYRQRSKPHTFKPLYGGTSGTPNEQAYYRAFGEKYRGVTEWHMRLQDEAIRHKRIRLPSGREYAFPGAQRTRSGGSTFATQIKNYPVQGFATADIVPCACIRFWRELKSRGLRSLFILTVHDSIVVDCYPGEELEVAQLMYKTMTSVHEEIERRYQYSLKMRLGAELKSGPNWLDAKEISVH